MEDATHKRGTSGMLFWVEYVPPMDNTSYTVVAGSTNVSISSQYQRIMPNSDLCCGALPNATNVSGVAACQRACDADSTCEAWTFKPQEMLKAGPGDIGLCTKRSALSNTAQTIWRDVIHSRGTTSGVKSPSLVLGGRVDRLQLTPLERNLTIQVYVDQVMAEGFWQGGRVAMTRECDSTLATGPVKEAGMSLFSSAATTASAKAWALHDAWITPQQLLRQPRAHG